MKPPSHLRRKEPGFRLSGKTATIVAAVFFGAAMVCVGAIVVLVSSQSGSGPSESSVTAGPSQTAVPQGVKSPATQLILGSQSNPVDFSLVAGLQLSCGLTCRQLTPVITNTGDQTAHNVCISLIVQNSGGDIIFLNGAPSIMQCVGNIAGGESKSEPVVINADCGVFGSRCLGQTLSLQTTVTSEEKTVRFPDLAISM
jgi:hypothetical protein